MTRSVPPGRNTNDTGPHSPEHYITQANRQNLPFESPVATFLRANTNCLNRRDAARIAEKMSGTKITRAQVIARQNQWEAESRDYNAIDHYKHHFTDMRGANTIKRANIVVKKIS